jgi:hypothetical protein
VFSISIRFYYPLAIPVLGFIFLFMIFFLRYDKNERRIKNLLWLSTISCIMLSFIWPRFVAFYVPGLPPINIQRFSNLLAIVSIILAIFFSHWFRKEFLDSYHHAKSFWNFFGLLCFFRFASIFSVDNFAQAFHASYLLMSDFMAHWIFILAGIMIGANHRNLRIFTLIITCSFFLNFLIGSVEYVSGKNLFLPFVDLSNPDIEWIMRDKTRDGAYRVSSIFIHPIVFGEYTSASFCFAIYTCTQIKRTLLRNLSIFVTALCACAMVIMSNSRAGFVAVAITFSLITFSSLINSLFRKKITLKMITFWSFTLVIALIVISALSVIVYEYTFGSHATNASFELSNQARLDMLQRTFMKLTESPILGFGPGTAGEVVGVKVGAANSAFTIDSLFLSYTIESGIVAVLAFTALIIISIKRSFFISIKGNIDEWFLWYAIGSSIIAFALFKIILSLTINNFYLFTILGITVSRMAYNSKDCIVQRKVQDAL